ncbi:hypothetical protein TIFTF001_027277 [Ficus carica]|uniref:Retrotransposon gag domain-containing protein n=1 Tax=Ficus carica TaxID=3494 RepID=A0AA88DMQ7_FICCA|nr:hypothetical protein TIFTF001_027277 [Ficus carica]
MLDDMMCKLFAQSLKGAALRWFCNLPPESIDSFDEISLEFMKSYSVHIQSGKTTKDLWGMVQGPHESLRTYIKCFSKVISEISGLDDGTAREALKKGLRHKSLFKNEPDIHQQSKTPCTGKKDLSNWRRKTSESSVIWLEQGRKWQKLATNERRHSDVNAHVHHDERSINPSELVAHLKHQDFVIWPKKLPENPGRDTTKYCEFHKDHGHQTIDCRAMRAEVTELLKKGHLYEFLTENGRETYGLDNESKERKIVQQIEDTPSPLPV